MEKNKLPTHSDTAKAQTPYAKLKKPDEKEHICSTLIYMKFIGKKYILILKYLIYKNSLGFEIHSFFFLKKSQDICFVFLSIIEDDKQ